jgi:hypothetical protein
LYPSRAALSGRNARAGGTLEWGVRREEQHVDGGGVVEYGVRGVIDVDSFGADFALGWSAGALLLVALATLALG